MRKRVGKAILYIFLIIIGLIFILGLGIISIPFLFPDHPNDWGWLEEYSSDQETFTMQEAYALIQPMIIEWNEDSYISETTAGYLYADDQRYHIQPDGRNPYWAFTVCSQNAGEWVTVVVSKGEVGLGVTAKPWGDIGSIYNCYPVKIGDVIDSNVAYEIAKEHVTDLRPTHLNLRPQRQLSLGNHVTWKFIFRHDEGSIYINIDAYNGTVLEIMQRIDGNEEIMDINWKR